MKKLNRSFYVGALIAAGFLATACGKMTTHYSSKAASGSASAATLLTPTQIQGEWVTCSATGLQTTYSFTGNGYWLEADQYSSTDCSDDQASSLGQPEEGTFQMSTTAPQAGYGQQITFTPYYSGSDSDGTTQQGYFTIVANRLILIKNGAPSINLGLVSATSSN